MNLAERFLALKGRRFTDEDGGEYELTLLPPMSAPEIDALEKELPCPIPSDIRALLAVTRGFENGPLDVFDIGGPMGGGFGLEEIFPSAWPIAHDGFGNYWVVDLLPASKTWGPIYYACHDAPVVVYQSADLAQFLDALLEFMQPPYKGPIDFVHEDSMHNIWSNQPNTIERSAALAGADPELRAFAETFADEWRLVDLRNPKIGDGFAFGRAANPIENNVKRWKTLPIFAYLPKKPLFQRLFGKRK